MELTYDDLRSLLDLYTQGMRIQHERNMSALQERLDTVTAERDALQAEKDAASATVAQRGVVVYEVDQEDAVPADGAWFTAEELANVLQAAHEAHAGHGETFERSALRAVQQQRERGPQLTDEVKQLAATQKRISDLEHANEVAQEVLANIMNRPVYLYVDGDHAVVGYERPKDTDVGVLTPRDTHRRMRLPQPTVYMHYRWQPSSKRWVVVLSTSSRLGPNKVPAPWSVAEWVMGEEPLEMVLHVDGEAEVIDY